MSSVCRIFLPFLLYFLYLTHMSWYSIFEAQIYNGILQVFLGYQGQICSSLNYNQIAKTTTLKWSILVNSGQIVFYLQKLVPLFMTGLKVQQKTRQIQRKEKKSLTNKQFHKLPHGFITFFQKLLKETVEYLQWRFIPNFTSLWAY